MQKLLLVIISASLSLLLLGTGATVAQMQHSNSTDSGKHMDHDAMSDAAEIAKVRVKEMQNGNSLVMVYVKADPDAKVNHFTLRNNNSDAEIIKAKISSKWATPIHEDGSVEAHSDARHIKNTIVVRVLVSGHEVIPEFTLEGVASH